MSNTNLNSHGFRQGQVVDVELVAKPEQHTGTTLCGWWVGFTNTDGIVVYDDFSSTVFFPWSAVARVTGKDLAPYRADADYQADWPGMAEYEEQVAAAKREASA